MSSPNLTVGRWRWRRSGAPKSLAEMDVHAKDMPPDGTFTDTLLQFQAQSLELPPEAEPFFPQGIPDPARGRWYKGTVEPKDPYADPLDNNASLGIFWAKLWGPTPTPPNGFETILLFQYGFGVPGLAPEVKALGVRIFWGQLVPQSRVATFYGQGTDNWVATAPNTFTLTQEPWQE